jgi:hypothetical protein
MEHVGGWTYVKNLKDLLELLGIFIAILGFIYWWWYNTSKSWWVWQVTFWPPKTTATLVQREPVLITLKGVIVNVSLFPKVINEMVLSVQRLEGGRKCEFRPFALMGPNGFSKMDGVWSNDRQELFRPLVAEARSNLIYHVLLVPVSEGGMGEMEAGRYEALLECRRPRGKPKRIAFDFELKKSEVDGFLEGEEAIGKLVRNLKIRP